MDNFMERITHKFTPADLILANSQADAAELDSRREQLVLFENQMEKVDSALTDMREVNLKNIESAEKVQDLAKASTEGIHKTVDESLAGIDRTVDESIARIDRTVDESMARIDKTVDESLAKIAEIQTATDSVEAVKELAARIDNIRKEMEDYMHTEHVKIYRNVQASMLEEFEKRTEEIIKATKKKGLLIVLMVITMVSALGGLALSLLSMLGIL